MRILTVIAAILIFGAIIAINTPKKTPEQLKQEQRDQDIFGFALAVREIQRNPASFVVEDAYIGKNDANCIVYRSQNGFGGMNGGRAVESGGKRLHDQSAGFSKAWNNACTVSQRDLRRYVQFNIEHARR